MLVRSYDDLSPLEKMSVIDISYSRLSTFDMCQAKYFYSYVIKEPRIFGEAATLGNIIHSVLEDTDFDAPLSLSQLHQEYRQKRPEWDPDQQISDKLIEAGYNMLTEFADRHVGDRFNVVAKELPFSFVLGSANINGYIDRIDRDGRTIRVVDYKAQPLETPILTPTGWTKMQDIVVGDSVIGADGKATQVVGVYPQGTVPAYQVSFTDGSSTVCSQEHLWHVVDLQKKVSILPLSQLGDLRSRQNFKYAVPTVSPVEFNTDIELPIPPYILGVILGDGGLTGSTIKIHSEDQEIRDNVAAQLSPGLKLVHDYKETWAIRSAVKGKRNRYYSALKEMGLWRLGSPYKFIPEMYLRSSIKDRIDLLKGLMDTDGGCSTRTDFRTSSPWLRDGVIELVRSLGANPMTSSAQSFYYKKDRTKVQGRIQYIINTRTPFNPFALPRKANHWQKPKGKNERRIKSIDRLPDQPMQCIRVANRDGLYVTENYIVTHNSGAREIPAKNAPEDLQLGMYALAISLLYPEEDVIRAELYYLRSGRIKGHDFTRSDIDNVAERVVEKVNELIDVNDFRPTDQVRLCSFCDFRSICPVGKKRFPN